MRLFAILSLSVALLLVCAPLSFAQIHLTARLDASQEVPSNGSAAFGTASFILSGDLRSLHYSITVNGLSPPATAAMVPLAIVSLYSSPGSRR